MTISNGYSSLLLDLLEREKDHILFMVKLANLNHDNEAIIYWSEEYMSVIGLIDEIYDQIGIERIGE